ncbi:MAG: hypothetical protein CMH54_10530 [Myxococcales bacterium]|nr:hypothetical protein [Myxococcales bacterium]|tara:strand:+ start:1401 stop:2360 length:960 start_codon:yes stop_codon:yes gene_type:complete
MNSIRKCLGFVLMTAIIGSGCSITKIMLNKQIDGTQKAGIATKRETDPDIAKRALPYALKQYEGLMVLAPWNAKLRLMAAQGFVSYAYGFIVPELWGHEFDETDEVYYTKRKAKDYLSRAHMYARDYLNRVDSKLAAALDEPNVLAEMLPKVKSRKKLEALYWVAYTWAQRIGFDTDDVEWIGGLQQVDMIMSRVEAAWPDYDAGGAILVLATSACKKGAGFAGGDALKEAEARFQRAMKLNPGYLMVRYMYARWYCTAVGDAKCYFDNLKAVLNGGTREPDGKQLTNVLAQDWARYWIKQGEEFFEPDQIPDDIDEDE